MQDGNYRCRPSCPLHFRVTSFFFWCLFNKIEAIFPTLSSCNLLSLWEGLMFGHMIDETQLSNNSVLQLCWLQGPICRVSNTHKTVWWPWFINTSICHPELDVSYWMYGSGAYKQCMTTAYLILHTIMVSVVPTIANTPDLPLRCRVKIPQSPQTNNLLICVLTRHCLNSQLLTFLLFS